MTAIIFVWVGLLLILGAILYFLRGLAHPQKMTYSDKISSEEINQPIPDESFLSFPTQIFNPFQKSHKASHLHYKHSIKSNKNIMSGFFPHQKAQKSKIPDTTHLKHVVDRHERHKKPKHHLSKHQTILPKSKDMSKPKDMSKSKEISQPKPLHAIKKIALIEELRQMVNKK